MSDWMDRCDQRSLRFRVDGGQTVRVGRVNGSRVKDLVLRAAVDHTVTTGDDVTATQFECHLGSLRSGAERRGYAGRAMERAWSELSS